MQGKFIAVTASETDNPGVSVAAFSRSQWNCADWSQKFRPYSGMCHVVSIGRRVIADGMKFQVSDVGTLNLRTRPVI
jgi:hypothetical protein